MEATGSKGGVCWEEREEALRCLMRGDAGDQHRVAAKERCAELVRRYGDCKAGHRFDSCSVM